MTLAAILWLVYKESTVFALRKEKAPPTPEWETAVGMIRCKSDFAVLEVLVAINGIDVAPTTKHKEAEANGGAGPSGKQQQRAAQKVGAKGGQPSAPKRAKMEIHPIIKAKLTLALPPNFHQTVLLQCCEIKDATHVFPERK